MFIYYIIGGGIVVIFILFLGSWSERQDEENSY